MCFLWRVVGGPWKEGPVKALSGPLPHLHRKTQDFSRKILGIVDRLGSGGIAQLCHHFSAWKLFSLKAGGKFHWRKIALPCCVGFCHTTMRISLNFIHTHTCIFPLGLPPLTPSHPSRPSQHQAELPVLHGCCPLAILHVVVYISEKETATHSSVLAWRIPGTGEPGGLLSMGSHRVRHDWSDLAAAAAVYICPCYSPSLSHPLLPHCVHKSILCVSIPSLQVGLSALFFLDSIYIH